MSERIYTNGQFETVPTPGDHSWDAYATRKSLERVVARNRAIDEVMGWLKAALIDATPDKKIWDIQKSVEDISPAHADIVGLVLDHLVEWGFVGIKTDGSFTLVKVDKAV